MLEIVPREVDVHFLEASIFKCYLYELFDFISKFLYSNKIMVVKFRLNFYLPDYVLTLLCHT